MWLEKTVDRESQQKLYVQIYSILREKIEQSEWPNGGKIPTEDELCRTYDVSKATVRLALAELVREGLLRRRQGKGTFVTYSQPSTGMAMRTVLTEQMFGEGVKASREVLASGRTEPSPEIKKYLNTEDPVYRILCMRVAEGEPACLEETFIPLALAPKLAPEEICKSSFYEFIQERTRRRISKVLQTIEMALMGEGHADFLGLPRGSPVLLMHRLFEGAEGLRLAYTRLYGAGRKYKLLTEFERIR
jgi:GntR family transcriptional regulator